LLRRLERRPLSGGSEFRSGRTPFDTLAVRMKITQGNVTVEDVNLGGPAVRLALSGEASIPARDLDLKGVATLVSTTTSAKPFELPFAVQGAWDDPLLVPDAHILIQRSGAAAPLLEALRARRDAARGPSGQPSDSTADEEASTPAVIPLSKEASTPPAKASEIKRDRSPARELEAAAPVSAGASPEREPAPAAMDGTTPASAPSGKVQ
jgi:AsmA protein